VDAQPHKTTAKTKDKSFFIGLVGLMVVGSLDFLPVLSLDFIRVETGCEAQQGAQETEDYGKVLQEHQHARTESGETGDDSENWFFANKL